MSQTPKLAQKDYKKDAEFAKAMYGSAERSGLGAVMGKNRDAQQAAVDGYFKHWDNKGPKEETEEDKQARLDDYADLTKHYYNLVTDFYEYGWGSSFHFSRYYKGEAFRQATARHEHFLAHKMGIREGMKVLDVGCGIGGPAREIQRFTGAEIVGLNNNDYQIARATNVSKRQGLEGKTTFVKGDFMQMDFPDASFDAVYAIEATVHAPVLEGVYGEIYRVLKPGGTFGVYEWVLTDKYDESNPRHREIAYGIEVGDGIPKMYKAEVAEQALKNVGFEIQYTKDLANMGDEIPWYYPLSGEWKYAQSLGDLFTVFRVSKLGRMITMEGSGLLEKIGILPKGTKKVTQALEEAAIHLVNGAKEELFTPMMLYIVKKPEN
ncbi:sterol 24-C-methyltransferase Erg6p [Trichomonascus vanleenenianus]|uniref:sterol 24-C-methyltransferase n=1 Tax=Trichomonascus vanleenenianus TaxID=2268995 RepID=UPI003ECA1C44